ncbi:MAG: hypothetical protein ABSH56_18805 [Bryobacteraceae bacterium]
MQPFDSEMSPFGWESMVRLSNLGYDRSEYPQATMSVNIGLDVGAVSVKLAALGQPGDLPLLASLCTRNPAFRLLDWGSRPLVISPYRRVAGSPMQSVYDLLREVYETIPESEVEGLRVTGSGSRAIARVLGLYFENEFKAIARMIGAFHPEVRTVFEIGGESSKYILLDSHAEDGGSGGSGIVDYDRRKRWAGWWNRPAAPPASPAAARYSPKAT